MKKINFLLATGAIAATLLGACSKDKGNDGGNPPPTSSGTELRGVISSNVTLTKDKTWTLRGYVYIASGATITIEAGTKIISKRDSAGVLIVTRGAHIDARGTVSAPIVFTSGESAPQPGDLGGVIIAGSATSNGNHAQMEGTVDVKYNKFGGTNDTDNSGTLQYVRIEYAGKATGPNDEVNGLTMYGVGSGTTIDHIQVIRGLDDGFEFFGGTFNAKYLIAYKCADDDFDFDDGFHGNLQYLISFKDPAFTDTKTGGDLSNNLEWDNSSTATAYSITPNTHARISNLTAIGPNNVGDPNVLQYYGFGARFRRGAQFEIVNSVFLGSQKASFSIESAETATAYKNGISVYKNNVIQSIDAAGAFNINPTDVNNVLTLAEMQTRATAAGVTVLTNPADAGLTDAFNLTAPKLMPKTGSILLTGAIFDGNFTTANKFETNVTYKGALGAADWTTGWTVFN